MERRGRTSIPWQLNTRKSVCPFGACGAHGLPLPTLMARGPPSPQYVSQAEALQQQQYYQWYQQYNYAYPYSYYYPMVSARPGRGRQARSWLRQDARVQV